MGNIAGLLFLIPVVLGIVGLMFVTVPGFDYMIGAAADTGDASIVGVVAWIFVLWVSTGLFVALVLGGSIGALVVLFD